MTYRILLPFDGTDASEWVLTRARSILTRPGAEATLLAVRDASDDVGNDAFDRLAHAVEDLRAKGIEATALRSEGDPAARILAEATEGEYDLLILASHTRPGSDVEFFGSVARPLIQASPIPVVILRPFFRRNGTLSPASPGAAIGLRTLLVPMDGSRMSERVLPSAFRLARLCGLKVLLFSTQETGEPEGADLLPPLPESLREWREIGVSKGLEVAACHRPGADMDQLFQTLDRRAVDLVALTTQERGRVANPTYDALAGAILTRSCLPVLAWRNLAHLETGVRGPAVRPRLGSRLDLFRRSS